MSVTVTLPAVMRAVSGAPSAVQADAGTVREALEGVVKDYPVLAPRIFAPEGGLQRFVNVYVDDEDIRAAQGLNTPIGNGSTVLVLSAVSGG